MSESRCGGGVGQIVRRHVHRLHRSYRTVFGRGYALFEFTRFFRQSWLIADCGRHPSEQSRNFAARLNVTKHVIYEKQYVFMLLIPEMLRHSKSRKSHAHSHAGRFVHLSENERGFIENSALFHFAEEFVTFSRPFSHACENRIAAVYHSHVVDKFLYKHGFTHARAAEQAYFAALCVRREQVYYFYARFEYFRRGRLFGKFGRFAMYARALDILVKRRAAVYRFAENVKHSAENGFTYGYGYSAIVRLHGLPRV